MAACFATNALATDIVVDAVVDDVAGADGGQGAQRDLLLWGDVGDAEEQATTAAEIEEFVAVGAGLLVVMYGKYGVAHPAYIMTVLSFTYKIIQNDEAWPTFNFVIRRRYEIGLTVLIARVTTILTRILIQIHLQQTCHSVLSNKLATIIPELKIPSLTSHTELPLLILHTSQHILIAHPII